MKLRDLARELGLAPGTVSRALNGYDGVGAELRLRVQQAADRAGYRPDGAARRLRTGRSETIGVLLSPPRGGFDNPFFVDWLQGIDEGLRGTPFHMVVTPARDAADEMTRLRGLAEDVGVDAVLFARTRRDDPRVEYLRCRGLPFATLGRTDAPGPPHPWLDIDHTVVGRMAAERLAAAGHRRIALANTAPELIYSGHCAAGFRAGLAAAGLDPDAVPVADGPPTEDGGEAAMRVLLAQPQGMRPTAVLCGNDLMAMGAARALRAAGLAPGRDVALIGCNDHPLAALHDPPLTTFAAPTAQAGERVARLLLDHMAGGTAAHELWEPVLIPRASDPPPGRVVS